MVENPVQQAIQGGMARRLSLGAQMKMMERERMRVMGSHLQHGRSRTNVAWLLLTLLGYINYALAGASVQLQQSPIFSFCGAACFLQL